MAKKVMKKPVKKATKTQGNFVSGAAKTKSSPEPVVKKGKKKVTVTKGKVCEFC